MATRVLGPTGSRRRRRFLFVSLILVACTALFLVGSAQAVHEFKIQLDGDVSTKAYSVNDASKQIYDWGANTCNVADTVAPATCATGIDGQTDLSHAIFKAVRPDPATGAANTEGVIPNPSVVPSVFSDASFQRDFESGASCTLNSTSTTRCGADDTTYSTGSKDTLGIANGGWQCGHSNNVNNKVDINNAYVASFWTGATSGTGDHILYAGVEKEKNNGTNDIGVWFLQGSANCLQPSGPNINWTGTGHRNGDVLLVSEFSNGGGVSTVKTFTWRASTDPASPFFGDGGCIDSRPGHFNPAVENGCNLLSSGGGGDCKGASVNDTTCATTNAEFKVDSTGKSVAADPYAKRVSTPWLASDATLGIGNDKVVSPDYIEMGINITKLFAGSGEAAPSCFSVGVPDTRSSPSVTATLFDYVVNKIGECQTTVTTTPVDASNHDDAPASAIPAAPANADVTVQDKATIGVTGVSSFSGSISWHICGRTDPVGPPPSTQLCDGTPGNVGVDLGTTPANSNGDYFSPVVHITAAGRYCFRAEFSSTTTGVPPGSDSSAGECFTIAPRTPTLTTNATTAVETGTALNDVAHLGNTAKRPGTGGPAGASPSGSINPTTFGGAAQGSITFTLYSAGTGNHCATVVGTSTVAVSGNGDYNANDPNATNVSGTFSPGPGTYYWRASYTGDLPNTTAKTTACDDANETSTVVDAKISITPTQTNEVGVPHTFTVTIQATDASGTFQPVSGLSPAVSLTPSNGASVLGKTDNCAPNPKVTDANGQCTVVFHSDTAGQVTGHASITFSVAGVSLTRATGDSHAGDSADAVKTYVDAHITIGPDDVNAVGDPHTFTVTVQQDDGLTAAQGGDGANGFTGVAGKHPAVVLTTANGASVLGKVDNCAGGTGTNSSGQCTVTFHSDTAGLITGNASITFSVGGVSLTRATGDTHAGDSAAAVKRYVDARITIGPPTATNTVGDPHVFNVTVQQDDGLTAAQGGDGVSGFGPAPDHTSVTVSLADTGGAVHEIPMGGDTCKTLQVPPGPGTIGGACSVTFTSQTAGTVTGNASVTFSVGGVSLTRDTDPATAAIPCGGGLVQGTTCGPAVKVFVAGSISWTKVDNANPPRALGGATFSLCRTATYNFNTKSFDAITPDCSFGPVVDNTGQQGYTGKDANPVAGQFQVIGLPLGSYSVQETAAPAGYVPDPNPQSVNLFPNDNSVNPPINHTDQTVEFAFVNSRPVLKITGLQYTNEPDATVDQPDGIVVGNTTFTVQLHNYGTAAAVLTDSSLVVDNPANPGPQAGLTCSNAAVPFTLPISQTIAAGASNSPAITLNCHYDHPNGKVITGTLVVKYTTNVPGDTLKRTASGSPATISFTVNPN